MEIQETNELIAEFMGIRIVFRNDESAVYMSKTDAHAEYFRVTKYNRYHEDWNMLLSVVEKIETLKGQFWIGKYATSVTLEHIGNFEINSGKGLSKIAAVYYCCQQFIKWYNKQKKS